MPLKNISAGRLRYVHLDTRPAKKVPSAPSKILDPTRRPGQSVKASDRRRDATATNDKEAAIVVA